MFKIKKLLVASLAVTASVFSASICALGAQIDSLSVVDNTIYASTTAENARLYVAEGSEGLLSNAFFKDVDNGNIELAIGDASDYKLFLWDKDSLAPISASYILKDGRAYINGSETPVPEYEFSGYTFNQEDDVMIVSAISDTEIKGFKAGVETTYALTNTVTVLGLSDSFSDVVPGSVVFIGTDKAGNCAAIELLASMGIPVDPANFTDDFGSYEASDGSTKYQNFVNEMFSKSGSKMNICQLDEEGNKLKDENDNILTTQYQFSSGNILCYRVGIAMDGDTPIITLSSSKISATKYTTPVSVIEGTNTHHNYVYLRYNTETERVTQCVVYCVPKDFNPGKGDGEYSDIFSLGPIVIIE